MSDNDVKMASPTGASESSVAGTSQPSPGDDEMAASGLALLAASSAASDERPADVDTMAGTSPQGKDTSSASIPMAMPAADDDEDDGSVVAAVVLEDDDEVPSGDVVVTMAEPIDDKPSTKKRSNSISSVSTTTKKKSSSKKKKTKPEDDSHVSTNRLLAASDARSVLEEAIPRLPVLISDTHVVRSFGRLQLEHSSEQPKFSSANALYPVGFSCDRYEFSPVHGRVLKLRCSIFDGSKIKKSKITDGPVFRVMWGQGVDDDADVVDYPYDPLAQSAYLSADKVDAVAVPASSKDMDEIVPEEGMRVRVRFDHNEWSTGTIVDVGDEEWDSKKHMNVYDITVQYDSGHSEDIMFPNPDIAIHLPGSEDEATDNGVIKLKEIRGKPVTSVIGASPLEAWGKALVHLGLIDEIMLKSALEAVAAAREEGLAEAKEKLETKKLQREQAKAKTQQKQAEKDGTGDLTSQDEGERAIEENGEVANKPLAVESTATDDQEMVKAVAEVPQLPNEADGQSGQVVAALPETSDHTVDSEPATEEEARLREKINALKSELGSLQATDAEALQALANSRIGALGPLLHNPFGDADTSTLSSWLASLVRKEKTKMGSTGNKKKVVAVTDLLERSNTFFNGDIEALVEGLPGSEFCQSYVFSALRAGGAAAINQAWVHEAKIRQERDRDRKRKSASASRGKSSSQSREKELKRKRREEERDQRKKQKVKEDDQKKAVRAEERLVRLNLQVDDRLAKEAVFQRERVIQGFVKNLAKEFMRRRKAAELVAGQLVVDEPVMRREGRRRHDYTDIPLLNRAYDEDVVRLWDFLSTFGSSFLEWGYLEESIPSLDSLQDAIDAIRGDDEAAISRSDAIALLVRICVALCQPLGASLTKLMFASLIALNPILQKDFGAAFFQEVNANTNKKDDSTGIQLPVDSMTWQEIARVTFLADALIELGYPRTDTSHMLRGYRSGGHPNSQDAKRLRKAEEFPLAVLRQQIDQGHLPQKGVDGDRRVCVQVPSGASSFPTDWAFYLHNLKSLPATIAAAEQSKECLRNAIALLKRLDGMPRHAENIADLERSLAMYGNGCIGKVQSNAEISTLSDAKLLALRVLDRAMDEPFSSDRIGHTVRQEEVPQSKVMSTSWKSKGRRGLTRPRIGHIKSIEISENEYKQLDHEKEEYMAEALRVKEEMERKANPDEEDVGSDDDDDDGGSQKGADESSAKATPPKDQPVPSSEKQSGKKSMAADSVEEEKKAADESSPDPSAHAATTVVNGEGLTVTEASKTDKIGKPTPYDEFCGNMPDAPELVRRCLAVLRTLCVSSPAEQFLFPVDPQSYPGYYEALLRPMCLQEVGKRLKKAANRLSVAHDSALNTDENTRQVEAVVTEFGRDIRLIAKNTAGYPNAGPAVIAAGEELLRIFERLFLDWVLSPEELLPPLDKLDDDRCVSYHVSDEESTVLVCDGCEGKYNITRLDPPMRNVPKGDWYCPRCVNGYCWADVDPRMGKRVHRAQGAAQDDNQKPGPSVGVITRSMLHYPEDASAASLLYIVRFDDQLEESWSLSQVDEALAAQGDAVKPVRCLEAVAESPGFGFSIDRGLYSDPVPAQLNPVVTEVPAQAWLSSSVFHATISASLSLLLISPEEMTASEWLRLLVLLVTKCSSSEIMQSLASTMESNAAEEQAKKSSERTKIQDVKDVLPVVSDEDETSDRELAIAVAHVIGPEVGKSESASADVVEATEIEVVAETGDEPVLSTTVVDIEQADEAAEQRKAARADALDQRKARQKGREDSIAAYCIKNQLRPIVASFEEDAVSHVVDEVLQPKDSGLSLAACRCRGVQCDFCGLTDTALGAPIVRVPSKNEWDELMPHSSRSRRTFLVADLTGLGDGRRSNASSKLCAVKVAVDGEVVSLKDNNFFEDVDDGGITEFLPRNERGFQEELRFRYEKGLPFVTGSLSAHECCAISAHDSRKDRVVMKHNEREAALEEQEAGMTCGRTLALGKDETGRSYWKFSGDFALFVCLFRNGDDLPTSQMPKSWHRFSSPEEIASIICYLGHDKVVPELRRAFPESAMLLPSKRWADLLLKRRFPSVGSRTQSARLLAITEKNLSATGDGAALQEEADSEDEPFEEGEDVLVESENRKLLWDAIVIGVSRSANDKVTGYRVHFKGWSSRFDDWVEPLRVVEPNENNLEVQEEMREELAALRTCIPEPLERMKAQKFLNAENRLRGPSDIPDLIKVAKVGPSATSEETTFGLLKAALLMIDAALPVGSVDDSTKGPWSPERASQWRKLVQNAAGPASLMRCVILLEESISQEYVDMRFSHLLSCLPLRWKAIKEASVASLALRIFLFDRGIIYDGVA